MEDRIGSIEAGKRADIVIHTLDRPEMIPTTDMIRAPVLFIALEIGPLGDRRTAGSCSRKAASRPSTSARLLRECNKASAGLLARMGVRAEPNRLARLPRKTA